MSKVMKLNEKRLTPEERVRQFRFRFRMLVTLPFLILLLLAIAGITVNYIPSTSMQPTLRPGDRILTLRSWAAYPFQQMPKRGDVIVFRLDTNRLTLIAEQDMQNMGEVVTGQNNILLIKRVIGLPGDTVQVDATGKITLNGQPLVETWSTEPDDPRFRDDYSYAVDKPITVPPGYLFVLGDNRQTSDDGRDWGLLKRDDVVGRYFWYLYNQPIRKAIPINEQ